MPRSSGCIIREADGKLLQVSGDYIYGSSDVGKTWRELAKAPPKHEAILYDVLGVLRSGRWLMAYLEIPEIDKLGETYTYTRQGRRDGYDYWKLGGAKSTDRIWLFYSDDRGKSWHGGLAAH